MENPRPRSPLTSSIICGSELHIANPVRGSNDRDFILEKLASVAVAVVVVEARDPSDLAFTSRSVAGIKFCKLPPRMFCKRNTIYKEKSYLLLSNVGMHLLYHYSE